MRFTQGACDFTGSNDVRGHHAEPSTHPVDASSCTTDEDVNELYVAHSPRRTALPLVVAHDDDDDHHHEHLELYVATVTKT